MTSLGVGVDDVLTVEVDGALDVTARSVLVPAGLRHRLSARTQRVAFVYLEPLGTPHSRCVDRMTRCGGDGRPVGADHVAEAELIARAGAGDGVGLRRVAVEPGPEQLLDQRIACALAAVHQPGGADLPTSHLARSCGLSPGHFLRLFGEQTGIGLRGYRRWARMRNVAEVMQAGGDRTRAAADAGFATPSHLSLAFRRMFGLSPSRLFGSGVDVRVERSEPVIASR